jgi:UDP-glucuronate 4-epimerase
MMKVEKFLVTGATGCIGSWVVKRLVEEGIHVWACSRHPENAYRLQMIMSDHDYSKVNFIACDVSNFDELNKIVKQNDITSIIHLAALQLPFCAADPILGAVVNVVGNTNIFEVASRNNIEHLVYSSSTAVYGTTEEYDTEVITEGLPLRPASHYGVYKQANEGTAKVYWQNNRLASIGLRPYVAYGPGRDQGMTSTPTKAIIAVIFQEDYQITFGGRYCLQYVEDIANVYIQAARVKIEGYQSYNIGGGTVSTKEFINELLNQNPSMKDRLSFTEKELPFPPKVDNTELEEIIGAIEFTTLSEGIRKSLDIFTVANERGLLSKDMLK